MGWFSLHAPESHSAHCTESGFSDVWRLGTALATGRTGLWSALPLGSGGARWCPTQCDDRYGVGEGERERRLGYTLTLFPVFVTGVSRESELRRAEYLSVDSPDESAASKGWNRFGFLLKQFRPVSGPRANRQLLLVSQS